MKRASTKWEEILANHVSDKGYNPEYVKSSYNSVAKDKIV